MLLTWCKFGLTFRFPSEWSQILQSSSCFGKIIIIRYLQTQMDKIRSWWFTLLTHICVHVRVQVCLVSVKGLQVFSRKRVALEMRRQAICLRWSRSKSWWETVITDWYWQMRIGVRWCWTDRRRWRRRRVSKSAVINRVDWWGIRYWQDTFPFNKIIFKSISVNINQINMIDITEGERRIWWSD